MTNLFLLRSTMKTIRNSWQAYCYRMKMNACRPKYCEQGQTTLLGLLMVTVTITLMYASKNIILHSYFLDNYFLFYLSTDLCILGDALFEKFCISLLINNYLIG